MEANHIPSALLTLFGSAYRWIVASAKKAEATILRLAAKKAICFRVFIICIISTIRPALSIDT